MWEWRTRAAQRIESVTGLRVPAANGATVKGIKLAETSLEQSHSQISFFHLTMTFLYLAIPLESPVVTAVCGRVVRDWSRVIH